MNRAYILAQAMFASDSAPPEERELDVLEWHEERARLAEELAERLHLDRQYRRMARAPTASE